MNNENIIKRLKHDPYVLEATARALHREHARAYTFSTSDGPALESIIDTAWAADSRNRALLRHKARVALNAAAAELEKVA